MASVPQRSPFRYPGGKTWFVPYFKKWLSGLGFRPKCLVEPFAGGGIISLTAVMEHLVDRAEMSELDDNVSVVWNVILNGDYKKLVNRIISFPITRENVVKELSSNTTSETDMAFKTILGNRVRRGGIMAPGAGLVKNGENGRGLASRWYPDTLAKRIEAIAHYRKKITFYKQDAFATIKEHISDNNAAYFIDPPYSAGGKCAGSRLYLKNQVDHEALFSLMSLVSGKFIMTYDDCEEVRGLAKEHGFKIDMVRMSNSHHSVMWELVVYN